MITRKPGFGKKLFNEVVPLFYFVQAFRFECLFSPENHRFLQCKIKNLLSLQWNGCRNKIVYLTNKAKQANKMNFYSPVRDKKYLQGEIAWFVFVPQTIILTISYLLYTLFIYRISYIHITPFSHWVDGDLNLSITTIFTYILLHQYDCFDELSSVNP